jgi:hypothetical protein
VPATEEQQALDEALDRLLDPLAEERPVAGEPLPPPMPEFVPLDASGPRVRDLPALLRRSHRGLFPIARRLAGWAVGLAAFWALVWIIVSGGALR